MMDKKDFKPAAAFRQRLLWREALRQPGVWRRACTLGLSVGLLQAALNQGDLWLRNAVDATVLLKSILSPLIGFVLVLVSASETWVQRSLEKIESQSTQTK
jgi:hypothetical protein